MVYSFLALGYLPVEKKKREENYLNFLRRERERDGNRVGEEIVLKNWPLRIGIDQ